MTKLPSIFQDLLEKFGRCKIMHREETKLINRFLSKSTSSGACVIVRTKKDEFVFIRHRDFPDMWTLPCGSQKENETLEETGVRETLEETGLNIQITGLHAIHTVTEKSLSDETRTYSYPVFFGEVISGDFSTESPETLEIKKFQKLPENFRLKKYYEDLT